jgi:capsular polysaccharide biosynthesis protein
LKESGILDKVDKILINYDRLDFQLETLSRMGIGEDKLINCIKDIHYHISADELYVPSYPNEHGTVNPWVCQAAKDIFGTGAQGPAMPRRLYISRSRAVGRRIVNEEEVFSYLQDEYGFERIYSEDFSMGDKVRLFGQAECIAAPHGGGVTNIIFSGAGGKVLDIFPPGDFDTFFWSMANSNKMEYYYLFGKGEMPSPENDFMRRNVDIDVDMERFEALMHLVKLDK